MKNDSFSVPLAYTLFFFVERLPSAFSLQLKNRRISCTHRLFILMIKYGWFPNSSSHNAFWQETENECWQARNYVKECMHGFGCCCVQSWNALFILFDIFFGKNLNTFQHQLVCVKPSWFVSSITQQHCKVCILTVADLLCTLIHQAGCVFEA